LEAKLAQMEAEMEELKQKNAQLEDANVTLRNEIEELKHDPMDEFNADVVEFFANIQNEKKYCCECNNVELTGYADIMCPSCLTNMTIGLNNSFQSYCERCQEVEVTDGNYICKACFDSVEVSEDYIPDNNSEDLDCGEMSPRGYEMEDSDE
jgi:hypothetical protein